MIWRVLAILQLHFVQCKWKTHTYAYAFALKKKLKLKGHWIDSSKNKLLFPKSNNMNWYNCAHTLTEPKSNNNNSNAIFREVFNHHCTWITASHRNPFGKYYNTSKVCVLMRMIYSAKIYLPTKQKKNIVCAQANLFRWRKNHENVDVWIK